MHVRLPRAFKLRRKSCSNGIPLLQAGIQRKSAAIQVNDKGPAGRYFHGTALAIESFEIDKDFFDEESKMQIKHVRSPSYLLLTRKKMHFSCTALCRQIERIYLFPSKFLAPEEYMYGVNENAMISGLGNRLHKIDFSAFEYFSEVDRGELFRRTAIF